MSLPTKLAESGFAVVEDGLTLIETDAVLQGIKDFDAVVLSAGHGGVRDVLRRCPPLQELITHSAVRAAVEAVLGRDAFAVRGILFDKHPDANWKVPWHQDLTVAVRRSVPTVGYGPWSEKAGIPHVQPPAQVLESMLTVRIHLDACDASNGPVRVLPGSHRAGRLTNLAISSWARSVKPVTCAVPCGGLLVMRPLLVHSSSAATVPRRRRVLHIDFASCSLAAGLEWCEQWRCAA
jgi:ectoine hydroxylase-related dioxygenase (phytanoyl-CoA dioxygenase family)